MEWLTDPNVWISLVTLTVLEIVLGIDNIIFISILAGKLPHEKQAKARTFGLMVALLTRVLLLCSIFWLTKLTFELFKVMGHSFTGKDLVLLAGGLFLLWKSVHEIHGNLEGEVREDPKDPSAAAKAQSQMSGVITQIVLIDIVFSLDSVITAVGVARHIGVMIAAVVIAMGVMLWAAGPISDFVHRHPTVKMLALSFLLLIGVVLVAEGLGQHINKGYIYFAMAFAFGVEMLNIRIRGKHKGGPPPVQLREPHERAAV